MAICKTWQGCEIVFERKDHKFPLYVRSIRGGKVNWTTDYVSAGHYSEKTARKHNEKIKAGEYGNIDGLDIAKTAKKWEHAIV